MAGFLRLPAIARGERGNRRRPGVGRSDDDHVLRLVGIGGQPVSRARAAEVAGDPHPEGAADRLQVECGHLEMAVFAAQFQPLPVCHGVPPEF